MAKVTLRNGTVIECGADIEQIFEQIEAAQKKQPPSNFIKCGGKYINHNDIVIIGREMAPDTDGDGSGDDKERWPIKVTIEGARAFSVKMEDW